MHHTMDKRLDKRRYKKRDKRPTKTIRDFITTLYTMSRKMSCKMSCAIALLLFSLLNATPAIAQPFAKTITQSAATERPYWNYKDTTGPDYWADLDPAFNNCKAGKNQSPINLTSAESTESAESANLYFHYEPVPLNLIYDGRTLEVPYAPGSYIRLNGQQYNLLQFHLHSPSEHTVNNRVWDAELHLVHQSDKGDLAVVAVLLQSSSQSSSQSRSQVSSQASSHAQYFELLSQNLPTPTENKLRTGQIINAQNLLPHQTTTYRYSGSLTTPPCSEPVTWLVMTEPVTLPTEQLAQYQKLLNHNNRPLQPPNNRTVRIDISH
ncbi:MAG: carbonic anhydrase [Phormidesmis priestleyi Ana]|uniref:carbonic anhydrase n=1 Tax=Phormidesmis priestleyi Ana TaxID=1666911 RepID=A0A0P7ZVU7_9CYAN|nr:MAG: carbonic anhydrase [Phormidesmis priestleyi Ana]